jgi:hypothetical protein
MIGQPAAAAVDEPVLWSDARDSAARIVGGEAGARRPARYEAGAGTFASSSTRPSDLLPPSSNLPSLPFLLSFSAHRIGLGSRLWNAPPPSP